MARKPLTLTIICALAALVTAAPASATYPGRNGLLVYSGTSPTNLTGAIGTMRADGTHRRQLVALDGADDAAWSPDGKRIAFTARAGEQHRYELFTIRADGTHLRRITDNAADDLAPSWGPRGGALAFIRIPYDAQGQPLSSEAELRTVGLGPNGGSRLVVKAPMQDAAWAPDGKMIAFADGGKLYIVPPSGGTPQLLVDRGETDLVHLAWTPESQSTGYATLSFTDYPGGPCDEGCTHGAWEVTYSIVGNGDPPLHANEPERVTPWGRPDARRLVWSPDGSRATYCQTDSGYPIPWVLSVMDRDGSRAHGIRRAPCPDDWQALPAS